LPLHSPNQINRNIKVKQQHLVDKLKASGVLIELKPAQVVFDKRLDGGCYAIRPGVFVDAFTTPSWLRMT